MPSVKTTGRALRISGWVITVVGLLIFYGTIFFAFLIGFSTPSGFSKAGVVIPAVGCLWLIGSLLWPPGRRESVAAEVALGILSLPPGIVAFAETYGDEVERLGTFWLVVTIFLLPGAIALIVQSARTWQAARRTQEQQG